MTPRILPARDCLICGSPVPPKPVGKHGPQPQVCSDLCRSRRDQIRHKAENVAAKERKRLWHLANRDRRLTNQQAAQTPETRAEAAARVRQWRKDNPAKVAANRKAWAKANPEKVAAKTQRRLARKRSAPADLVTVTELLAEQSFRCYICGNVIDLGRKYPDPECPTIDHLIPLSRGGSGLRSNLRAAHMRCNSAKGVKVVQP